MGEGIEWINLRDEISVKTIEEVGKILSVKFPIDYINYLTKYNGATPNPNIIKFGVNEVATIESLLSFNSEDKDYILEVYNNNRYLFSDDIVPFGKTKWIDLICFDYRNGRHVEPIVVYWNYDLSLENINEAIYPICNTFIDFINKLSSQK